MPQPIVKFSCDGCKRTFTWKPELAGKRAKCKCGQTIDIPAAMPSPPAPKPESEDDFLYALAGAADDARQTIAKAPPTIVPTAPDPESQPAAGGAVPLAYQRGPTRRERERATFAVDPRRDIQVPLVLLGVGALLYISYYVVNYHLAAAGTLGIGIGLIVITSIKAALLIGFAMVVAAPLGVAFGGFRTAILKFAAIALFCDGVTTWVDGAITKYAGGFGGGGPLSFGAIGYPVAIGIFWVALIYLFTMDPGDSWFVVIVLSIFYRIMAIVLIAMLLPFLLSFGNVPLPSGANSAASPASALADEVEDAKIHQNLHEARQYVKDYGRRVEDKFVRGWYDAGCPNVWFETIRDINGSGAAVSMIAELPSDKSGRTKCIEIARSYYTAYQSGDPQSLRDTGQQYILVRLP